MDIKAGVKKISLGKSIKKTGIRKGREHYGKAYENAVRMHKEGKSVTEIAKALNISYSTAYHWAMGLRKPETGNVSAFVDYLGQKGPTPVIDLKNRFPKHNELFLIASGRGFPVKRLMMQKKFADYSVWYYLKGQEAELEKRTDMLIDKIREVKNKLSDALK